VAEVRKPCRERGGVIGSVAVDDNRPIPGDPLLVKQALNFSFLDGGKPRDREGNGAGDVPAALLSVQASAAVGGGGARVDEDEVRIGQTPAEIDDRD